MTIQRQEDHDSFDKVQNFENDESCFQLGVSSDFDVRAMSDHVKKILVIISDNSLILSLNTL